jgi:hypothetical protein
VQDHAFGNCPRGLSGYATLALLAGFPAEGVVAEAVRCSLLASSQQSTAAPSVRGREATRGLSRTLDPPVDWRELAEQWVSDPALCIRPADPRLQQGLKLAMSRQWELREPT